MEACSPRQWGCSNASSSISDNGEAPSCGFATISLQGPEQEAGCLPLNLWVCMTTAAAVITVHPVPATFVGVHHDSSSKGDAACSLDGLRQEEDFTGSLAPAHGTPSGNATTSMKVNLCKSCMLFTQLQCCNVSILIPSTCHIRKAALHVKLASRAASYRNVQLLDMAALCFETTTIDQHPIKCASAWSNNVWCCTVQVS